MPVHDSWLRVTPYELALPGRGFVDRHFPAIAEEVEARGADPGDPGAFVLLAAAGAALKEIRGESEDAALIHQHGLLLFHGWHLWRAGEPLFLLRESLARRVLGEDPVVPGWTVPPEPLAGYVQLPQHLVWIRQGEGERPESVDGFFWASSSGDTLSLLYISGVIRDRPGFSVIPLPALPRGELGRWADVRVREDGEDFATTLPGGELEGLRSLETGGEAVKLAARILRRLAGDSGPAQESPREPGGGSHPIPSSLEWRCIGAGPRGD